MKKFLLRILIVLVLVVLGGQAFLWLLAHQGMQKFQTLHTDSGSLDYRQGMASLDGSLTFESIEYTSFVLKRSGRAESLKIEFGGIHNLFQAVIGQQASFLDQVSKISIMGVVVENEGRDLSEWISTELNQDSLTMLRVYDECLSKNGIDQDVLSKMGIPDVRFDAIFNFADSGIVTLDADFKALGAWTFSTDLLLSKLASIDELKSISFSQFDLSYNDQGFFRRLSNYCEEKNQLTREDFALVASQRWQNTLLQKGMVVDVELTRFYKDFMQLGGLASLSVSRDSKQTLAEWIQYDTNLLAQASANLTLNGKAYSGVQLVLQSAYFDPVDPEVLRKEAEERALKLEKARQNQGPRVLRWSLENVKAEEAAKAEQEQLELEGNGFIGFPRAVALNDFQIDDIANYIGSELNVELIDDKSHKGQLIRVEEFLIELDKPITGGKLSYSIDKNKIKAVEIKVK